MGRWKWVPAGDEHAEEERRNTENRNPFGGDLAGASVLHPLCVLERERERGERRSRSCNEAECVWRERETVRFIGVSFLFFSCLRI